MSSSQTDARFETPSFRACVTTGAGLTGIVAVLVKVVPDDRVVRGEKFSDVLYFEFLLGL